MTARSNDQVTAAIGASRFDNQQWQTARRADGESDDCAEAKDLTDAVDLTGWPERTRFIARRERLHPGAQRSLFDSETWR